MNFEEQLRDLIFEQNSKTHADFDEKIEDLTQFKNLKNLNFRTKFSLFCKMLKSWIPSTLNVFSDKLVMTLGLFMMNIQGGDQIKLPSLGLFFAYSVLIFEIFNNALVRFSSFYAVKFFREKR